MADEYKMSIKSQPGIFTLLSYDLLSLVDKGQSLPMDQFMKMCSDYTIMKWIKENTLYYDIWEEDLKIILAEEFCSLANCVIPEHTYGVSNNGILALVAFCQEYINHPPTRSRIDCDCAEDGLKKLGLI